MKSDSVYIKHMLDSIDDIERSTKNISKDAFLRDKDIQDANLRRIEILGEAVKNISSETKSKNQVIAWKKIAGTRDVVIHAYFNVDWNLVWEIIQKDIKVLKEELLLLLKIIDKV
jgi:uncharacterized protein with HEPN domain